MTLLVGSLAVMFVLSPLLSLGVVVFVPVFACVAIRFRDPVVPGQLERPALPGAVAGVVDEAVTGVRVVKAFAQERARVRPPHRPGPRAVPVADAHGPLSTPATPSTLQALPMLAQLGVLAFGGWLALDGPHHARRVPRLRQLPRADRSRRCASRQPDGDHPAGPRRRRAGLRAARPGARRSPTRPTPGRRRPARRASSSTTSASATATARRRCTTSRCASRPGERIGLVGASGSGKSTLALLIARFYDPTSGTVRLDGDDVRALTPRLAASDGQRRVRGELPVLDDDPRQHRLRPARRQRRRDRGRGRVAQAHDFILELPDGYDTVVGERGFTLSGGQRQRIALARAALANPQVLVLDDATSAIDARTEEAIHASLDDELGDRTTVLIAHRSSTLRLADRVLVLDGGRIVAEGTERRAVAHVGAATASCSPGPSSTRTARGRRASSTRSTRRPGRDVPARRRRRTHQQPSCASIWQHDLGGGGAGRRGAMRRPRRPGRGDAELLAAVDAPAAAARRPRRRPRRGDRAGRRRSRLRRLVRPFRWPLLLVAALVLVDAAHDARRPAAHPPRHRRRRRRRLDDGAAWRLCVAFLGRAAGQLGQPDRRAAAHVAHRRADAVHPAGAHVRPPPAAVARLLRPRDGRADHDPHDHRRRGASPSCSSRACCSR